MKIANMMLVSMWVIIFASTSSAFATHMGFDCLVCHDEEPTPNLYDIRTEIDTPNSGIKPVVFTAVTGYVSAGPIIDGVCQVCHTVTAMGYPPSPVWRNDGTGMDHGGADFGMNCTACHLHDDDFLPTGGGTGPSHDIHLRYPIKGPMLVCYDCHGGPPFPFWLTFRILPTRRCVMTVTARWGFLMASMIRKSVPNRTGQVQQAPVISTTPLVLP